MFAKRKLYVTTVKFVCYNIVSKNEFDGNYNGITIICILYSVE